MNRTAIAALLLVLVAVWFAGLESRKLLRPDEGRYAEIAREMAVSGDWLTPRLNGLKYFEKPPLQYWATAAFFDAFGVHQWTARLWAALTGLAGIGLVFFIARVLYGAAVATAAAAILASSLWYLAIAHINTLDMGLTLFMTVALAGFLYAERTGASPRQRIAGMMIAWTGMALAVLSKGLIGIVLPSGVLVFYSLWQCDAALWQRVHIGYGLVVFMAIAAPWFVLVSLANPEFAPFFFFHEHLARFSSTTHRREGAPWYFVPYLLAGLAPWTLLFVARLGRIAAAARAPKRFHPERLLIVWCAVIFVFFSLSGSKLPSYILPMFPGLALLLAPVIVDARPSAYRWNAIAAVVIAIVCIVAAMRIEQFASAEVSVELLRGVLPWLTVGVIALLAGALLAWRWRMQAASLRPVVATAIAGIVAWQSVALAHDALSPATSSYHLVRRIVESQGPFRTDVPFFSVQTYEQTMPFYLNRTLTLVDFEDEMRLGLEQEPDKALSSVAQFIDRWRALDAAYATMRPDTFDALAKEGVPMRELGRDTRRVIVSRR